VLFFRKVKGGTRRKEEEKKTTTDIDEEIKTKSKKTLSFEKIKIKTLH